MNINSRTFIKSALACSLCIAPAAAFAYQADSEGTKPQSNEEAEVEIIVQVIEPESDGERSSGEKSSEENKCKKSDGDPNAHLLDTVRKSLEHVSTNQDDINDALEKVKEALSKQKLSNMPRGSIQLHGFKDRSKDKSESTEKDAKGGQSSESYRFEVIDMNDPESLEDVMVKIRGNTFGVGQRYRIGVQSQLTSSDKDGESVVRIEQVVKGSVAEKSGLKNGDVVLKVNGESLKDIGQLSKLVQQAGSEAKELKLLILRDKEEKEIAVTPEEVSVEQMLAETIKIPRMNMGWISGGGDRGANLPPRFQAELDEIFKGAPKSHRLEEEVTSLREDIKKIQSDVSEIKEMLKKLKD